MVAVEIPRALNLGNVLVVVGVLLIGTSFWLPHATAARMSRIEQQAELYARRLCDVAEEKPGFDLQAPDAQDDILQRLEGNRLEPHATPARLAGKALFFKSKHYYYMLTRTPLDRNDDNSDTGPAMAPQQQPVPGSAWRWPWRFSSSSGRMPFEVYAWPATLIGPGVTVFFHPSDAPPAFCRNLDRTYHGLEKHPMPGKARKQFDGRDRPGMLKWYRGFDDARWLLPHSDDDI